MTVPLTDKVQMERIILDSPLVRVLPETMAETPHKSMIEAVWVSSFLILFSPLSNPENRRANEFINQLTQKKKKVRPVPSY